MTRALAALAAVLFLPLLVLPGLALTYQATAADATVIPCGTDASQATADPDCVLPPPPTAGAMTDGRCVPDPSGTGGCVTPALANLFRQVEAAFGPQPVACWSPRPGDPHSDHPQGRACDYTIGRIGTYPSPADTARGWRLAHWLQTNAAALHVDYIIWQGHIWSPRRVAEGWRTYTGGGQYRSDGPTYGHYDHVHVSVELPV